MTTGIQGDAEASNKLVEIIAATEVIELSNASVILFVRNRSRR